MMTILTISAAFRLLRIVRAVLIHEYRQRIHVNRSISLLGSWSSLPFHLPFNVGSSLPGGARMIEQEHSWRIGVRMQMRDVATWSTTGQLQISVDCNTTIMTLSGAEKE